MNAPCEATRACSPDRFNAMARRYVEAMRARGAAHYVETVQDDVALARWGAYETPVTVSAGARASTFVCSPRVAYVDYVRDELPRFATGAAAVAVTGLTHLIGALLTLGGFARIVHVNNWMLSTNLRCPLDERLAASVTQELAARYPDAVLAFRSLTWRRASSLMTALAQAGWMFLPARKIYLVDDVAGRCLPRTDTQNDAALSRSTRLAYAALDSVSHEDAGRIAALYRKLYLDKYTRFNPAFTPAFIQLTSDIGLIRYFVFRDGEGCIQGFGGVCSLGGESTMPLIGYNTDLPRSLGLYRLIFHAGVLDAYARGLALNMSSGVPAFKRNRGGTLEIEHTAYFARHLCARRRLGAASLAALARMAGPRVLDHFDM